ncbi:MAG: hypothetical protein H7242_09225 [Microbacteriaceae bacterium]|nr:hypothetical protein [Burkholderiaceae bacterium]
MNYSTGKLAFIVIAAVLLACIAAWVIAGRYRAAMRRLMSTPKECLRHSYPQGSSKVAEPHLLESTPAAASKAAAQREVIARAVAPGDAPAAPTPQPVSVQDNRRADLRLALLLITLSGLMALSSAALFLGFDLDDPFSFKRLGVLALVRLWPVIPALGLMWRWSRLRLLGTLLLWCVLCFGVMLWRSIEPRPLELLVFLAGEVGVPMLLVALLCLGDATRAIASWLLPPLVGLVWASVFGVDVLALMVEQRSPWLLNLPSWLGPHTVIALFALTPWLIAWWPLKWLGRGLARAYVRKWLSELMVLFTAVWAISLLSQALGSASSRGLFGGVMLLPLLWIPLAMAAMVMAMALARRRTAARGRPPTLLVLRVFQHDAQVRALFDDVIERWRLTGNTVLIAGTDLADRTLGADDIFTFLDGGLAQRFIHTPADVAPRLAGFDLAPDADGRFRINELYCHDTTWQDALAALVQHSDVVLMDLRGFQAHNAGCLHELATLARASSEPQRLARVVVLVDAQTDRAAADAAVAGAPVGRFVWVEGSGSGALQRRRVLDSLFVADGEAAPVRNERPEVAGSSGLRTP